MYADTIETIITKSPHIKEVPYFSGIEFNTPVLSIKLGQQAEPCLIRDQGVLILESPLQCVLSYYIIRLV